MAAAGFPLDERYPTVTHLDVHLENGQIVSFNESYFQDSILSPKSASSNFVRKILLQGNVS